MLCITHQSTQRFANLQRTPVLFLTKIKKFLRYRVLKNVKNAFIDMEYAPPSSLHIIYYKCTICTLFNSKKCFGHVLLK